MLLEKTNMFWKAGLIETLKDTWMPFGKRREKRYERERREMWEPPVVIESTEVVKEDESTECFGEESSKNLREYYRVKPLSDERRELLQIGK